MEWISIQIEAGVKRLAAGSELKVEVSLLLAFRLLDQGDGLAGNHLVSQLHLGAGQLGVTGEEAFPGSISTTRP